MSVITGYNPSLHIAPLIITS